ncbi:MAG TPA: MFS transporter [Opitutaceae bacterium]
MPPVTPPDGSAPEPFHQRLRWRMTAFLAVAAALNFADRAAMSAVLSAVRVDLALSDVALGMLGSFFLWSYALGSPFAGSLADRWSRSRLVVVSLLAWSVVTALTGLAGNFSQLLALRIGLGLAECLFFPAAFALIAQHHGIATRARAMSLMTIGINSGMILGGTAAGFLAQHFGWRSGFLVLGITGIVLALCARPFLPATTPAVQAVSRPRPSLLAALPILVRIPTYWSMVCESMLSGMGMWIFFSWLPLYLRETYGMSLAAAGFSGTFMLQISVMLGIAVGGWVSDRAAARAPHRRVLLYGSAYLIAAPFLLLFLGSPTFGVVAAGIAAFSFLRGMGQANDHPTLCEVVPPELRSTGIGLMNACATASGGCGVLLAGFLKREVGLGGVFAGISGAFMLAGMIMLFTYVRFSQRDFERARASETGAA